MFNLKTINKKLKYIKFKICWWFHENSPIYIYFDKSLFKDFWKIRKVFYKPYIKKYKLKVEENNLGSDYFYIETSCNNKWFYLSFNGIGYKTKYGEFRYENVPYICLIWKNKIKYIWGFECPLYEDSTSELISTDNMLYYEGILTYLYEFNRDIIKTYFNNIWTRTYILKDVDEDGKNKRIEIKYTLLHCLKPKYANKIMHYSKEKYFNKIKEEEEKCSD